MNFFSLFKRQIIYNLKKKINVDFENNKINSLEKLFIKYGCDKANIYRNIFKGGNGYAKFYLKHLRKLKNKKINILEIGSLEGSSAVAFSKFFKKSKIYCFDINISNFKYASKNISVFGLDASKEKSVNEVLKVIGKEKGIIFDVIIDDGSHKLDDILKFLKIFFKHLKNNGFYIIEEFKFPNYYRHLNVPGEPKIEKLLSSISRKKYLKSNILTKNFQKELFQAVDYFKMYKGNNRDFDIVFIKKIK